MFELKKLSPDAVESALEKAQRYRLLNEPREAASICRDVLAVDPANPRAIVTLLLSITDGFAAHQGGEVTAARELLPQLASEYERHYYAGIISERRGKSILDKRAPGCGPIVYDWLRDAMESYEKAESLRPSGNDEAILRWNTCARLIQQHDDIRPAPLERVDTMLE